MDIYDHHPDEVENTATIRLVNGEFVTVPENEAYPSSENATGMTRRPRARICGPGRAVQSDGAIESLERIIGEECFYAEDNRWLV
jgi:hypothetical protein